LVKHNGDTVFEIYYIFIIVFYRAWQEKNQPTLYMTENERVTASPQAGKELENLPRNARVRKPRDFLNLRGTAAAIHISILAGV
jgi:hypothetical protein